MRDVKEGWFTANQLELWGDVGLKGLVVGNSLVVPSHKQTYNTAICVHHSVIVGGGYYGLGIAKIPGLSLR